jgi:putative transposase
LGRVGIPLRTLRRWILHYRKQGLKGLKKQERKDKGIHKSINEEYVLVIQALALQKPALPISMIVKKIRHLSTQESATPPSYSTIYNIIRSLNPALLTMAQKGSKEYNQQYGLVFRRESIRPNGMWQIDHTLLDVMVLDEKGKLCRPWLTIVLDDYSRAVPGYFLSLEAPCAVHTALALRKAIWRKTNHQWPICGIPQILYTDNGTDFISEHIEQVCINLNIRLIHSIPLRPQGRGKIERFFGTLNTALLVTLPGYTLEGKPATTPTLNLSMLESKIEDFILNYYHHTPSSTTKLAPFQRWSSEGFLPNLPASLEELDLLLLTVQKPRKVRREGIFFQGLRYMSPTIAAFVGEMVEIRYDPRDMAEIRVYHKQKFICQAFCQEIADRTISLKDIQKARRQIRKDLYKQIKQTREVLKKRLTDPLNPSSPVIISELQSGSAPLGLKLHSSPDEPALKADSGKTPLKLYKNE